MNAFFACNLNTAAAHHTTAPIFSTTLKLHYVCFLLFSAQKIILKIPNCRNAYADELNYEPNRTESNRVHL